MSCSDAHNEPRDFVKYTAMLLSLVSFICVILTTLGYKNFLQLLCVTNSACPSTPVWTTPEVIFFYLLETFISLTHPFCYIKSVNFCTWPCLYFAALLRIPLLFRQFYLKSPLLNNTTNEIIACLNDIHMTNAYYENISTAVKVAGKRWTYQLFFFHTALIWFLSAWLLSLAEATHGLHNRTLQDMNYTVDAMLWLVPVTMMTVGYGDYYPVSAVGKLICIFVGFYGLIASARMVVIHVNKTKMTKRERIVYNQVLYREMKSKVRITAAIFIQRAWREKRPRSLMATLKSTVDRSLAFVPNFSLHGTSYGRPGKQNLVRRTCVIDAVEGQKADPVDLLETGEFDFERRRDSCLLALRNCDKPNINRLITSTKVLAAMREFKGTCIHHNFFEN